MMTHECNDILRMLTREAVEVPLGHGRRKARSIILHPDTYNRLRSITVAHALAEAPDGVKVREDAAVHIGGVPIAVDERVDRHHAVLVQANGSNVVHRLPYRANLGPESLKA